MCRVRCCLSKGLCGQTSFVGPVQLYQLTSAQIFQEAGVQMGLDTQETY